MPTLAPREPVALIPPAQQTLWRWPAVLNFCLGGLGAGFYVVAAVAAGAGPSRALTLAAWLGPLLVLAGFGAVATEAGRPLRGVRVLARVATSWMSRELWLGGAFALLAAAGLLAPAPVQRLGATLAAVALALAQGFILREARGVPVWAVPVMPLLFLSSALVSGAGLLVLVDLPEGPPSARVLGGVLAVLTVHMLAWAAFVSWSRDPAFSRGVRCLNEGNGMLAIVGGGYLVPSLLGALAIALPMVAWPLAAASAALMIASQIYLKAVLILRAGELRPITLPNLRLTRRSP